MSLEPHLGDPSGPVMADQEGINALDRWASEHRQAARTIQAFTYAGMVWLAGLVWDVFHFIAYAVVAAWTGGLIIMNWRTAWVRPLWDRTRDTAKRLYSWIRAALAGRLFHWRSAERRTAEIAAEAESVARALAMDTPEADLQLAAQRHAFAQQIDALSALPARDYHQEMQLAHLGRMIKDIDAGRFGPTLVQRPMAELGEVGQRRGFLGSIASGGLMQWVAVGGVAFGLTGWGAAALQGVRLDHAKNALEDVRADLATSQRALVEARETANVLADNVREAAEQSRQTAETIETERARRVRAERERRRVQDAVDQARAGGPIDYGFGSMRDAGAEPLPGGGAGPAASDSR